MVPLDYVTLRLMRRHLPDRVVRLLLRRGIILKAGLETSAPAAAARRFLDAARAAGETVAGRRLLILGYGGHFGVGVELLRAGARHVVLVDPYADPATAVNLDLARAGSPYLRISGSEAVPDPDRITVVDATLRGYLSARGAPVDLVFSNSVLEHVEDLAGTVSDLMRVTTAGGHHFHFIDLRDHFFRHPFEMLCYSEAVWRRLLNPGSNLNRQRAGDFERVFSARFPMVSVEPLGTDLESFRAARPRIRPEFLTGDESRDAVSRILLRASLT